MTKTKEATKTETRTESTAAATHKKEPHIIVHATPVHYETVCQRAYDLFVKRGCVHGFHLDDWLEAERQLTDESIN